MKKTMRHAWQLLGVVALLAMVAGCADGELATPVSPDITPPAPIIIKFAATPSTIESGATTTISWEVAGADEVEITAVSSTGAMVDFNVKTEDLSGEAPVSLTSTTDFVLTATKSADNMETEEGEEDTEGEDITLSKGGQIQFGPEPVDEQPSGSATPAISSVTQTITVTVVDASNLTATLNADKPVVAVGEQTVIRWTVNPAENVSVVVTADSGEAISPTDACEGSITDILGQPVADPVPAVGCAVVAPSTMTTYLVTATDSTGDKASDTAVVDVEGDVNAKIMAAKDETSTPEDNILQVESFNKPVIISWTVTPEAAKVTVTAAPSATCTPELPVDAEGQTTGSASCTISGETRFTIKATLGTETDTDDVIVSAAGGNAGLVVADAWAFKGETISLDMRLTTKTNPDVVAKLLINGSEADSSVVEQLKSGSTVSVPVINVVEPVHIQLMDSSGEELDSEDKVSVVGLAVKGLASTLTPDATITERRVSHVMFDESDGTPYAGVELDYTDMDRGGKFFGKARIYKNHAAIEFNFVKSIKDYAGMDDLWNDAFFYDMDTYPTVVGVRKNVTNDIFAGTTGAIMRSSDGGSSWENVMVSRRRADTGYNNSQVDGHPTCGRAPEGGQKIQHHRKPQFLGDFISLNQVCDIIVLESGRVIAAMDFGVMVEKNIDNDNLVWVGIPSEGVDLDELGALTFGKVVNDILEVDGKIFAATSEGIYVSSKEQGGIGWESFDKDDDVDGPVWSLAYDKRNDKIYAGNDFGIHASPPSSPDWDDIGLDTTPVLSIAVDPKSPVAKMTIIAGTPTGVMITRDGGHNWNSITLEGGEQPVESLAIYATDSGSTVNYSIAMGTSLGELFQDAIQVGAQTVPPADLPTYTLAPGMIVQE
jgi:hypothetical protein